MKEGEGREQGESAGVSLSFPFLSFLAGTASLRAGSRVATVDDDSVVGGAAGLVVVDDALLDDGSEREEGLLDVDAVLGRRLHEGDVVLVSETLSLLGGHDPLLGHVALVTDEHLADGFCGVLLDVADPVANVAEGLFVRDVIDKKDSHGSAVVGSCDGAEAFLTSSVPDLKLDFLAIELNGTDLKVDSDGGDETGGEGVIREAEQKTGLSDTTVSDQEELDEVIVL